MLLSAGSVLSLLTITAICLFITNIFIRLQKRKGKKLIPGPWGFPIVGHLPLLTAHPPSKMLKWTEKYGPIFSLKFGSLPVVVLNKFEDVKEAFSIPELSGRPTPDLFDQSMKQKGIVFAPTLRHAVEQRQFVVKNFKHFGQRQVDFTETKVLEEIYQIEEAFRQNLGQPVKTMSKFNAPLVNSFWSLITNKTFKHDDPELHKFSTFVAQNCELPDAFQLLSFFVPWTSKLLIPFSAFPLRVKRLNIFLDFIQKEISGHRETRVEGVPRDFIDSYLDKESEMKDESSSFHEKKNSAPMSIFDIFTAGMETASTAMDWLLFYMAKYQHVQQSVYEEIERVVGPSRPPSLSDRPHMPYTEAVIHEMFRASSFNPFGFFHSALADVHFKNYFIPKGTVVISNLHALHHDPQIWNQPTEFNPERFLQRKTQNQNEDNNNGAGDCGDDNSLALNKNVVGKLLPFGCGKRVCVGEELARNQIFLYTVRLFQQFHMELVGGDVNDAGFGFTVKPPSHELIIREREFLLSK